MNFEQDSSASVDMNVVMTGSGEFVEIQGTGEETTFTHEQLEGMLNLAKSGIEQLFEVQKEALGTKSPKKSDQLIKRKKT